MNAGIVVVNKPPRMTSQQAVTTVKRILGYKKAGHSGILDPDVTGVLPVFLGKATRLAEYVTENRKEYEAEIAFGIATDTQDQSGSVIATGDPRHLTAAAIRNALSSFCGVTMQTPPQYSAVKIRGVRAYDMARAGKTAEIAPRPIQVYELNVLSVTVTPDQCSARFRVICGKGTYIRTLCHDCGVKLGVPAHMSQLVRTQSGPFALSDAHSLAEIAEMGAAVILAPEVAVRQLPACAVTDAERKLVEHGAGLPVACARMTADANASVAARDGLPIDQEVRLHDSAGTLIAIYRVAQSDFPYRYILHAKKVLLQTGAE